MLVVKRGELNSYVSSNVSAEWERRNFVKKVDRYMESSINKVLVISGLRGVGKTVGLLQAIQDQDAVYITAQQKEQETIDDYFMLLQNSDAKIIVIDEYSWIKDREKLDGFLFTLVQQGKRVIITGTESIILTYLNYGDLIHRLDIEHVTYFSYEEYCNLHSYEISLRSCESYLKQGGLFESYVINNYNSMSNYVKTAIIDNLVAYCGERLDRDVITTIVYTILYKAVCDSTIRNVPVLRNDYLSLVDFLELMNANVSYPIETFDFDEIASTLEAAGIIVRIQNYRVKKEYRTYVTNPSITYQLIKCIYKLSEVDRNLMGYMFESSCVNALYFSQEFGHKLYYAEGRKSGIDFELDLIDIDESCSHNKAVHLFECKLSENTRLPERASLVNPILENLFADCEIQGRYVVYNGEHKEEYINGYRVVYDRIDNIIARQKGAIAMDNESQSLNAFDEYYKM